MWRDVWRAPRMHPSVILKALMHMCMDDDGEFKEVRAAPVLPSITVLAVTSSHSLVGLRSS